MTRDDDNAGQHLDVEDTPREQADVPAKLTKAVALDYDREEDPAPRIVASGKGAVAEQILTLAFANGVKVRKDEDLVEVLSKLEVDSVIPLEAFAAVAEILSYVYRANQLYGKSGGATSSR